MLGHPGSKMSFLQRLGRCGRVRPGLAVYLPWDSVKDRYYAYNPKGLCDAPTHTQHHSLTLTLTHKHKALLEGELEHVAFNSNYLTILKKHIIFSCAESVLTLSKLKHTFGPIAEKAALALLEKREIRRLGLGFYIIQNWQK